tara:strand:- start:1549 stop:1941 length:393 start_codon:yes stop_codon:yes gene_type:complete
MKFKLTTIIDITQTLARRGDNKKLVNQQANYNTMIQTIGLRVNINPNSCKVEVANIKGLGFGDTFKGKHRYWEFTFDVEAEDALTLDMLATDFDLVPVITNLDETTLFGTKVFRTKQPNDTNIVFEMIQE